MNIINNITNTLKDDLSVEIKKGSKISIAAACFSIYAFQELKKQLTSIDELRFIFTSPICQHLFSTIARIYQPFIEPYAEYPPEPQFFNVAETVILTPVFTFAFVFVVTLETFEFIPMGLNKFT